MPETTPRLGLKKPYGYETVKRQGFNDNWDALEQKTALITESNTHKNTSPIDHPDASITDAKIGQRTPDQTQTPASPGTGLPGQLFSWLANRIKVITGKTNWWENPSVNLENASNHMGSTNNPHSTTAAQVKALVSVDGVSNDGGDIDLIAGTGITITPDNPNNRITITATGGGAPSAHANTHADGGSDPVTPASIKAETPSGAQSKVDTHANLTSPHLATAEATSNRLIVRDANGRAKISSPLEFNDIANKWEVMSAIANHLQAIGSHDKPAKFVIGTSIAGWQSGDCNYLCDGTDDQYQINDAIAALPVSGGEIIILNGTYNISAKINVNKNNVSIRGNGNATIFKRMWDSTIVEGVINIDGYDNCIAKTFRIDGNKGTYTSSNNCGIFLNNSGYNKINDVFCNNNATGIYLSSSSNNTVTGDNCNNNSAGIYLYNSSNNNTVTGNNCNNNYNNGIYLNGSSNNTVTGNICYDNSIGIYFYNSNNNTVTGNNCNNNNGTGIYLSDSSNNTVTGDTCIRGTGQPGDYTSNQYTIRLFSTNNNYNLMVGCNCKGKDITIDGGTGNQAYGNLF